MPTTVHTLQAKVESSGVESFQNAMGGATQSVGGLRTAVGLAGAALAGTFAAALGTAVSAAADFEEQMTGVEKVTSPETADEMAEAIRGMASEMPVAHQELATIAETAGRLGVSEEHLESFTESTAKMAAATDLTAEEAADSFARISTLMNLPMEDAELLGSAINDLANNFGTSASEITDVMTRAGASMESLGVAEDEALGLAAAMNEVSPSSRLAAGGLQRISEALMDPGTIEELAEAYGKTPEEFRQMREEDPTGMIKMLAQTMNEGGDRSEDLRQILGKQASELDKLGSNLGTVDEAQGRANKQFEEGTALQEEFETASSTFNSQLEILKNRIRNVAIQTGEVFLPYAAQLLDKLNSGISILSRFNEKTDGMAAALTGVIGIVGGVAAAVGSFTSSAMAMSAAAAAGSSALAGLGTAVSVLTGPIGIAIAAIAGLAYAWKNNLFGIRDRTNEVVTRIEEIFSEHIGPITQDVEEIANKVRGALIPVLQRLKGFVQKNMPLIRSIFGGVFSTIGGLLERLVTNFLVTIDIITDIINGDFGEAASKLKSLIVDNVTGVINWLTGTGLQLFKDVFTLIGRGIIGVLTWIGEKIYGIISGGINSIVEWLSGIGVDDVEHAFFLIGRGIRNAVTGFIDTIIGAGGLIKTFIGDVVSYFKNDAKDDVKSGATQTMETIPEMAEEAKQKVIGAGGVIKTMISDIGSYLKNDAKGDIKEAIGQVVDVITAAWEGLKRGLIGNSLVPDMFEDIASYIKGAGKRAIDRSVGQVADTIENGFNGAKDAAIGVVTDLFSDAKQKFRSGVSSLKSIFNDAIPDSINVPSVSVGGGGLNIPSKKIPGTDKKIGGGRLDFPSKTLGGQSLNLPSLDTGGLIESDGLAEVHAGEEVLTAAEVKERNTGNDNSTNINVGKIEASSYSEGRDAMRGMLDEVDAQLK